MLNGERVFATDRLRALPRAGAAADERGWIYSEPNPYNPPTNLRPGEAQTLTRRPEQRRAAAAATAAVAGRSDVVMVPAFTDFKLHDITDPTEPAEAEPLDMNQIVVVAEASARATAAS